MICCILARRLKVLYKISTLHKTMVRFLEYFCEAFSIIPIFLILAITLTISACSTTRTLENATSKLSEEIETPSLITTTTSHADFEEETIDTGFDATVEKIQWEDAYTEFLHGIETFGYIERDYIIPGNFYIPPVFYIYDIDQDGIPELILLSDDGNWENSCCDIFAYSNSTVQKLGSIKWDWFGEIGAPKYVMEGLFSDDSYKRHYGSIYYYTIQDGMLVEQLVCEYQFRPHPGEKGYIRIYDDSGNISSFIEDSELVYAEERIPEYEELFGWVPFCFYAITDESIQAAFYAETFTSDVYHNTKTGDYSSLGQGDEE